MIPIQSIPSTAFVVLLCLLSDASQSAPRKVLASDYSKKRIAIVDHNGAVEWEHPVQDLHDMHRLPNGNILFQTSWTQLLEMTPDKQTVWSYDAAKMNGNEGKRIEVHAFQRLPDGSTMIVESGPGRIIEVDPQGRLLKAIQLKRDRPNAHSDTRLARKLPNGHYLVAQENDGKVREYDPEGEVVWEYQIPLFGKPPKGGHGPEGFGNALYCALRLANGNTLIATGNGHSILEVTPGKEIVWSVHQNDLPGIQLAWVTTLAALPNGNIILGNCHAGPDNPQIIEITRDKQVVWSFKNFDLFGNALPASLILDLPPETIR